jgi:hypothetical protein
MEISVLGIRTRLTSRIPGGDDSDCGDGDVVVIVTVMMIVMTVMVVVKYRTYRWSVYRTAALFSSANVLHLLTP